jgi:hypothetical protein
VLGADVLTFQEFTRPQIGRLVRQCGKVLGEPDTATRFMQALDQAGKAAALDLAARPGHLVHMLVTYMREGVVLTAEEELMQRVATARFAITGRVTPSLQPDEPVDKQQVVEDVSFHLAICQQGKTLSRAQMLRLVRHALLEVKAGGQSVYAAADGVTMLADLCHNSGFLKQTPRGDYDLESVPWMQFFAACLIARKLQDSDEPVTQWVYAEEGAVASAKLHSTPARRCPWGAADWPPFSRYLWRREWHGVILILAGLMADATPLLQRIAREPDDIFERMLALRAQVLGKASHVDSTVVQETCARLIHIWQTSLDDRADLAHLSIDKVLRNLRNLTRAKTAGHVTPLISTLYQAFSDAHASVCLVVAERLGQHDDVSAVPALCQALTDPEVSVRQAAVKALYSICELQNLRILANGQIEPN